MKITKRDRSPNSEDNRLSSDKKIRVIMSGNSSQTKDSRFNYWSPLQCQPDDENVDNESMDEIVSPLSKKVYVPPIKLLQKSSDYVQQLMQSLKVTDYFIKNISIGIKIVCESIESYKCVLEKLKTNNCQFFSHDLQSVKAFKVVLYGMNDIDVNVLKNELIRLGLKCIDIKKIIKKYELNKAKYTDYIYLISLESGSIPLRDLRKNYRSIFHTQISWSFQRKLKGKVTQCHNCQMFGHGERNCRVKTYCAICAGPHTTSECDNTSVFKCANCNESHKATDITCISRSKYLEMKANAKRKRVPNSRAAFSNPTSVLTAEKQISFASMTDFPSLPQRRQALTATQSNTAYAIPQPSNVWANHTQTSSNVANTNEMHAASNSTLFSFEELNSLAMEMITKLSVCKTKVEQFEVITHLATKFLSSNCK